MRRNKKHEEEGKNQNEHKNWSANTRLAFFPSLTRTKTIFIPPFSSSTSHHSKEKPPSYSTSSGSLSTPTSLFSDTTSHAPFPFLDNDEDADAHDSSGSSSRKNNSGHFYPHNASAVCGSNSESGSPLSFSFSSFHSRKNFFSQRVQTEELQALCRLTNGQPIPSMLRVTCRTTLDRRLEWIDIGCTNDEKISSMEWGKGLREYLSVLGVPSGEAMLSSNYFSFPHASVLDGCHCVFTRMAARHPSGEGQHSIQNLTNRLSMYILDVPSATGTEEKEKERIPSTEIQERGSTPPSSSPSPHHYHSSSSSSMVARWGRSRRLRLRREREWIEECMKRRRRKRRRKGERLAASLSNSNPSIPTSSSTPSVLSDGTPGALHSSHSSSLSPLSASSAAGPLPPSWTLWKESYEESARMKNMRQDIHPVPYPSPCSGLAGPSSSGATSTGTAGGGSNASTTATRTLLRDAADDEDREDRHHSRPRRGHNRDGHHIANTPQMKNTNGGSQPLVGVVKSKKKVRGKKKKKKNQKMRMQHDVSPPSDFPSLPNPSSRRTLLITAHRTYLFCVHELHLEWEKKTKEPQLLGALLYFFMKRILGSYLHNLIQCMVEFDGLETSVFRSDMPKEVLTRKIYDIKRKVAVYERCLSLTRETYAHVMTALPTALKDQHFYELQHRMGSAEGLAKDLSKDTESALELLFQWSSYEVNELMRFLTLFSAFFIPLNFITSIYGMNFEGLPFVDSPNGGWYLAGVFLFGIIGLLTWFRARTFL